MPSKKRFFVPFRVGDLVIFNGRVNDSLLGSVRTITRMDSSKSNGCMYCGRKLDNHWISFDYNSTSYCYTMIDLLSELKTTHLPDFL